MAQVKTPVNKYEYARLIAARVTELSQNAQPHVQARTSESILNPLRIAEAEFATGVLPFKLARRMPSGSVEICSVDQLILLPDRMDRERAAEGSAEASDR